MHKKNQYEKFKTSKWKNNLKNTNVQKTGKTKHIKYESHEKYTKYKQT